MKTLILILLTVTMSGCVVYPSGYWRGDGASRHRHGGYDHHDAGVAPRSREAYRDRDGVPNRQPAQPANPRRW